MKFALAGGGTGGHVYPALAVAEELRAQPDTELVYYGTKRGPEHQLAVDREIAFRPISAAQFRGRSPVRVARGAWNLWRGGRQAGEWLRADPPAAIFATGGYASAPLGRPAKRRRVPLVLFLPDVKPGWAAHYLLRYASTVACSVEASTRYLDEGKAVVTGYPVRRQFLEATREAAIARFELDPNLLTLLVAGGSQGSHPINLVISEALRRLLDRTQVIHLAGVTEERWLAHERDRLPEWQQQRYRLFAYTEDMALAMAASDLAVTRAGASTLGELPAIGLPAIVIPGDFSDQHLNAAHLVEHGAAVALPSRRVDELEATIMRLLDDAQERASMAAAMRALARPDAAQRLAAMLREQAAA